MHLLGDYFLLSLRLVGGGWLWALSSDEAPGDSGRRGTFVFCLGRAVALGLLINLLPALVLASFQVWTPLADWMLWGLLLASGFYRAQKNGFLCRRSLVRGVAGIVAVWALGGMILFLPARSEWLAGGWDPGIYQNNALVISRDHGIQGRPKSIYTEMTEEECRLFTRSDKEYHEVFPGAPVLIGNGALPLYFFHLSPLCGAWFHRMGGLNLLYRMPALLGAWSLLPALALFGWLGMGGWKRWLGIGFWLASPMGWYQQAIPTSEMLYLFLLMGGLLLYIQAVRNRSSLPVGAALSLFAATVNHLNAVVLLGFCLLLSAAVETAGRVPGRRMRMICCYAALALALVWNFYFSHITILRLEEKDHVLRVILPVFGFSALFSLLLTWKSVPERWVSVIRRAVLPGCVLAGALIALAALGVSGEWIRPWTMKAVVHLPWLGAILKRFLQMIPFQGAWSVAGAGAGLVWMALDRNPERTGLRVLAFTLGSIVLALFVELGITPLYPWALRRYLVFLIPFLVLAQSFAVIHLVEKGPAWRPVYRWIAGLFLLAGLGQGAWISLAAARVGDYRGMGPVIFALNDVLNSEDVVVADDPRWGTPLLLAGGREVINGRRLWQSKDPDYQQAYMTGLQRLQRDGLHRVLWLTSTEEGLQIYPVSFGNPSEPLFQRTFSYRTVQHSSRARTYEVEENTKTFRLYTWDGAYQKRQGNLPARP